MKKFIIIIIASIICLNAQYKVERLIFGGAEKFGEKNKEIFNVYENDQKIFSIERILNYDDPFSEAKLFNDGSLAIVNSFLNKIDFYSNTGNIISTVDNIDDEKYSYEKTIYFDADLDEAAFLISNEKTSESRIEIYSKYGNKIKTLSAIGSNGKGILYNQEKDLIVYSSLNWNDTELEKNTLGINTNGKINFQANNIFSEARIDNNIFAGFSNKSLLIIDLFENKILQNISINDKVISDLEIFNGEVFFLESDLPRFENNKWNYSNLVLKKYSVLNNKLETIKSINKKYEAAELKITDSDLSLLINNSEKHEILK